MSYQQYLWSFETYNRDVGRPLANSSSILPNIGPAPMLKPLGFGSDVQDGNPVPYAVNVTKDFTWTTSPQNNTSVGDVPTLVLKEKRIKYNPIINQIANNSAIVSYNLESIAKDEKLREMLNKLICFGESTAKNKKKLSLDKARETAGGMIDGFKKNGIPLKQFEVPKPESEYDPMAPYTMLLTTEATGWRYKLPYMEDAYKSLGNQFGSTKSGVTDMMGMLGSAKNTSGGYADMMKSINVLEPGVYIEKPKFYNFTGREKSYTARFPLVNTLRYSDVVKNWQLLYLLIYQNLPNRVTRDLIDPPVIYEALLPGVWYSKYACISSLNISFMGSRRSMTLSIPNKKRTSNDEEIVDQMFFETIIPDAYMVDVTITELYGETQNTYFTAIQKKSLNDKVTVGAVEDDPLGAETVNNVVAAGESLKDKVSTVTGKGKELIEGATSTFKIPNVKEIFNL